MQKIFVPSLVCPGMFVVSFLLYVYGKFPLLENKTFKDRFGILYTFTASYLLGKILFSPTLTTTGGNFVGFAWIGVFLMICIHQLERVSHHNPLYVSPPHNSVEISSIIHSQNMRFKEFYVTCSLESNDTHKEMLTVQDEIVELNRRRRTMFIGFVFLVILILVGNNFVFSEKKNIIQ
jgi:hypothetical protein